MPLSSNSHCNSASCHRMGKGKQSKVGIEGLLFLASFRNLRTSKMLSSLSQICLVPLDLGLGVNGDNKPDKTNSTISEKLIISHLDFLCNCFFSFSSSLLSLSSPLH
ncbi:hypothetical protein VNO78_27033 [Psophocarpus tetragonolobus]|uniref:Uncharacterized protein n=1 Tax=Psophocarpus tetragonolobus TaxID=3891 RepID=A0AAN9X9D1_PSOTE